MSEIKDFVNLWPGGLYKGVFMSSCPTGCLYAHLTNILQICCFW